MPIKPGKVERTKKAVKKTLNINTHNKWLFVFETILLVGVLDEFLEGLLLSLELNVYLHIFLTMAFVGVLFTLAFSVLEPWTKRIITWTIRINQNKQLRFLMHVVILAVIYLLYAHVFFATNVVPFEIGFNLSR